METGVAGRVQNRGTVLVASTNMVFAATVAHMVSECGFTPAFPARFEGPWLSLTRTQPRVVICDFDAQVALVQRLIVETSARRVPLVIVHQADTVAGGPTFAPVERVTWLGFPVSPAIFSRVLLDLVAPARDAA
jgi:hypothetical protein